MRFLLLGLLFMAGCAPYGPWMMSSQDQRDRLIMRPGNTVEDATQKHGLALKDPNYNPRCKESYWWPPSDANGTVWYRVRNSIFNEEVTYVEGIAISVRWVKSPWKVMDHQLRADLFNAHLND